MFGNNQSQFNQQPGKVVTNIERFQTQSGQAVEIRRIEVTVLENNILRKEQTFEVCPPLNDNRIPDSVADIRECCVCLGLYHRDSVMTCPACGGFYDYRCRGNIRVEDNETVSACALCAKEANTGLLKKLSRRLWRMRD